MNTESLNIARERIALCQAEGFDHLNLACLGLTQADLLQTDFAALTQLRYLDLTSNALTELPLGLSEMKHLRWLGLNFNQLRDAPGLDNLRNLERLYLRGNAITALPNMIGALSKLVELDLTGNRFANPSAGLLALLEQRGEALYLAFDDNPGEFTLRAKDGITAFTDHVRALLKAGTMVREGKLLLVGEGRMGKSTLLRALQGESFEVMDPTHGLRLEPLDLGEGANRLRLNCWDFSGQRELRETHQIFFTEPAIYLVVWNGANSVKAEDLREWLWLIQHRTNGKGRALIVQTNSYAHSKPLTDAQSLRDEFGGEHGILIAPEFMQVECKDDAVSGSRSFGIDDLRKRLTEIVSADESFCQRARNDWRQAQEALLCHWNASTGEGRPFLPWAEFDQFCQEHGLAAEMVKPFARHQHDVGRMLWVDRGEMAKNVILSPDWLSKALGYVVRARRNEGEVGDAAGLMSEPRIHAIWKNPQLTSDRNEPEPAMPEEMFPAFEAFMEEFDMAHAARQMDGVVRYLIPQRLLPDRPQRWDEITEEAKTGRVVLRRAFQLKGYDGRTGLNRWLARAFFFRLMVRFQSYLTGRLDEKLSANWECGFCIEEPYYGRARIQQEGSRLLVEGAGTKPDKLVYLVQHAVEELAHSLKQTTRTTIVVEVQVPCLDSCTRSLRDRCFVAETEVLKRISTGRETMDCKAEGCLESLPLDLMLDGRVHREASLSWQEELIKAVREAVRSENQQSVAAQTAMASNVANLASIIDSRLSALDDPARLGPCLFLIEPVEPEFWKHRGDMFGKQFKLHLFCEKLKLPVSALQGTEKSGAFEFTMDHAWWQTAQPYLKAAGRALAAFMPGAGLLGCAELSMDMKHLSGMADHFDKLLALDSSKTKPDALAEADVDVVLQSSKEARGYDLNWLHSFLKAQCKTDDLTNCHALGLVRIHDKAANRYLWVHPSQSSGV